MDPYCVVKLGGVEFKSKVAKHGGKEPKWDEFFEFKVDADSKDRLTFEVFDQELISHAKIGRVDIPLDLLIEKHNELSGPSEFQLVDFHNADKSAGYIRFKVKWHTHVTKSHSHEALNNMPIIGIYALPSKIAPQEIIASYVKWIESAGARVVPLSNKIPLEDVKETLSSLNGLLFTGGSSTITDNARALFKQAVEFNKNGDYFPVWGTCLGFEWIIQMAGNLKPDQMDQKYDAENYAIPVKFTDYGRQRSRIFEGTPEELKKIFATEDVTLHLHQGGLSPEHWQENNQLTSFFHLVGTDTDRKGREFVSMYEGKTYPVYGSQWHPEKVPFEFCKLSSGALRDNIQRTRNAVWASQHLANFFVGECRKSSHKFPTQAKEDAALIYSYPVTRTTDSEQTYYFNWPTN